MEGQSIASMTVDVLKSIRNDDSFVAFWENKLMKAKEFDIGEPLLPRKRRQPQLYEDSSSSAFHLDTAEHHCKVIYFEALDLVVNCIERRFDQPGYNIYIYNLRCSFSIMLLLVKIIKVCYRQ